MIIVPLYEKYLSNIFKPFIVIREYVPYCYVYLAFFLLDIMTFRWGTSPPPFESLIKRSFANGKTLFIIFFINFYLDIK